MKQLILAALCAAITIAALAADPQVPYPEGYRDWHHVKSMVIEEGHPLYGAFGGIHHLYANDKAMEGYRKGTFPDGSVIVFDLLEAGIPVDGALRVLARATGPTGSWARTPPRPVSPVMRRRKRRTISSVPCGIEARWFSLNWRRTGASPNG